MVETNDFVPMSIEYNLGHLFYPLLKNDYQEENIRGIIDKQLEKENPNFKSIFFDLEQQTKSALPKIQQDIFHKLLELLEHTPNQAKSLQNLWDLKNSFNFILDEYYKYSLPEIFDYQSLFFQYGLGYNPLEELKQLFTYLEMKLLVPDHFTVTMNLLQEYDATSNDQIVWNLPSGDPKFEPEFLAKFLEVNSIPIPEEFKLSDGKNATLNPINEQSLVARIWNKIKTSSKEKFEINSLILKSRYIIIFSNNLIISYTYDKSLLIYGKEEQKILIKNYLDTLVESKLFLNTQLYFIDFEDNSKKFELSFNKQLNETIQNSNSKIMIKWLESLTSNLDFKNLRLLFNQLDIKEIKKGDWLPKNISLSDLPPEQININNKKYKSGISNKQINCNIILEVKGDKDLKTLVEEFKYQALFKSIEDSEDAIIRKSNVEYSEEKEHLVNENSCELEQILKNIIRYDPNFTRENIIQFCLQDTTYLQGFYIKSEREIYYYFIIKQNDENLKEVIADSYQNKNWLTTVVEFGKSVTDRLIIVKKVVAKSIHFYLYNIFNNDQIFGILSIFLENTNKLIENLGTNIFFKKERAYLMLKLYLKYLLIRDNKQTKTISLKYFQNYHSQFYIKTLLNFIYDYITYDRYPNKKTSFNLTKAFEQVDDIPLKSLPLLGSNINPFLEQILQYISRPILLTLLNTEVKEAEEILNFISDQLIDDQSLIYSLFNNINWMKLIKPLEIEMIITVDRSFLEGILQEYYDPEPSKSIKHWCFIMVDQEEEFIKKLTEKKLIIKDDYLINNNYHQNNQQLFLIDYEKIKKDFIFSEIKKYIKYIYNPISRKLEKDKSELDSQDIMYKYVTNKQIVGLQKIVEENINPTPNKLIELIKSIQEIKKKRIEIYKKIKELSNSDNKPIDIKQSLKEFQIELNKLIHESLISYNLVVNKITDDKKIHKFKQIFEPFMVYNTISLTHLIGTKLSESKSIISQDTILKDFIKPDFTKENNITSDFPRLLCDGFNDPVKLLIFRLLKNVFNILINFLKLESYSKNYKLVVNSKQADTLDLLYHINISQYGKLSLDDSKLLNYNPEICGVKFQFEHQKNYLLGQMMDLFTKDIDKLDEVRTTLVSSPSEVAAPLAEGAPTVGDSKTNPQIFLDLIKYDLIDFNQTPKLSGGKSDIKKILSRKINKISRGLNKKKTRKNCHIF